MRLIYTRDKFFFVETQFLCFHIWKSRMENQQENLHTLEHAPRMEKYIFFSLWKCIMEFRTTCALAHTHKALPSTGSTSQQR